MLIVPVQIQRLCGDYLSLADRSVMTLLISLYIFVQVVAANAETYSKQINSPSFGAKSHVEPGKTAVKAGR